MQKFYCVASGPSSRHLINVSVFDLKRDAIKFIESLDNDRAYKFTRHVETCVYPKPEQVIVTVLDDNII